MLFSLLDEGPVLGTNRLEKRSTQLPNFLEWIWLWIQYKLPPPQERVLLSRPWCVLLHRTTRSLPTPRSRTQASLQTSCPAVQSQHTRNTAAKNKCSTHCHKTNHDLPALQRPLPPFLAALRLYWPEHSVLCSFWKVPKKSAYLIKILGRHGAATAANLFTQNRTYPALRQTPLSKLRQGRSFQWLQGMKRLQPWNWQINMTNLWFGSMRPIAGSSGLTVITTTRRAWRSWTRGWKSWLTSWLVPMFS